MGGVGEGRFLGPALESSLTLGSEWGPLEDLNLEDPVLSHR